MVKSVPDQWPVHKAGAYPSFCSMKWLGVFLLPHGWDASPTQGCAMQHYIYRQLFIQLEGERHCKLSSVKYLAQEHMQHNDPDQGSYSDLSIWCTVR